MFLLAFDQIPKIKIYDKVAIEHTKVIGIRRWLIPTYVFNTEEESDYGVVDGDGAASDKEYKSVLLDMGMRTGVVAE